MACYFIPVSGVIRLAWLIFCVCSFPFPWSHWLYCVCTVNIALLVKCITLYNSMKTKLSNIEVLWLTVTTASCDRRNPSGGSLNNLQLLIMLIHFLDFLYIPLFSENTYVRCLGQTWDWMINYHPLYYWCPCYMCTKICVMGLISVICLLYV